MPVEEADTPGIFVNFSQLRETAHISRGKHGDFLQENLLLLRYQQPSLEICEILNNSFFA